jgi:hypothetical protein
MNQLEMVNARRAVEALRSGVPNRDAVRFLGCHQPAVERRFEGLLEGLRDQRSGEVPLSGLLLQGGFGSGKSHVLEYLQHQALERGFVCSRIVISKETPLYDVQKVFLAAVETGRIPNQSGQMVQELALKLDTRSARHCAFYQWAASEMSGLGALFPATVMLHERLNNDPELVEAITGFWAGHKLALEHVRRGLKQVGAAQAFQIRPIPMRELGSQRFVFLSRLIQAAGYRGWVLLVDEVELIGRYSLLQRARSYAEIARWMGMLDSARIDALTPVFAVTDDFATAVLDEKGDLQRVGEILRAKGGDYQEIAPRAEFGMNVLQREAVTLERPDRCRLEQTYRTLAEIYRAAYGFTPPPLQGPLLGLGTEPMRAYIRAWINSWDILRLCPGQRPDIEIDILRPDYSEDTSFEKGPGADED